MEQHREARRQRAASQTRQTQLGHQGQQGSSALTGAKRGEASGESTLDSMVQEDEEGDMVYITREKWETPCEVLPHSTCCSGSRH